MENENFDHYRLMRRQDGSLWELGRGAMAVTYKALDQNLRHPVALKVIDNRCLEDDHARARFVREARAAAALRHPNIASVHHLGTDARAYFYAMEFVAGETVEQLVARRGPLRPALVLAIAEQVTRALGAAARAGLVHRDIKPANIMIAHPPDESSADSLLVKVIDFGLARPAAPGPDALITIAGFVGTPAYASPEQINEHELDSRSDIYSLGVTMWFMLTGRQPFVGSAARIAAQHLREDPPWRDVARVPASMLALLKSLLQKDPADRPADPIELRHAIEKIFKDSAVRTAQAFAPPGAVHAGPAGGTPATPLPSCATGNATDAETTAPATPLPPPTGPGPVLDEVVGGRFSLSKLVAEGAITNVFRARDTCNGDRTVAVKFPRAGAGLTMANVGGWRKDLARLLAAPHPRILAARAVDQVRGHWYIAEDWVNGFTLVDLLRRRGRLELTEALPLFEQASDAATHASANGLRELDLSPDGLLLHFPAAFTPNRELAMRNILGQPLAHWPKHEAKLRALTLYPAKGRPTARVTSQTMVAPLAVADSLPGDYCTALALLLYEMLNGAPPTAVAREMPPLTTLNEEANELLGRVANGETGFPSERDFYQAIVAAAGVRGPNANTTAPARTDSTKVRRLPTKLLRSGPRRAGAIPNKPPRRLPRFVIAAVVVAIIVLISMALMRH